MKVPIITDSSKWREQFPSIILNSRNRIKWAAASISRVRYFAFSGEMQALGGTEFQASCTFQIVFFCLLPCAFGSLSFLSINCLCHRAQSLKTHWWFSAMAQSHSGRRKIYLIIGSKRKNENEIKTNNKKKPMGNGRIKSLVNAIYCHIA